MRKLDAQIRELESEKVVYAEFLAEGELTQEEYDEIIADLNARLKDLPERRVVPRYFMPEKTGRGMPHP